MKLVRKTSVGDKAGTAKVAVNATISVAGKDVSLGSMNVPAEAEVVYDTLQKALLVIRVLRSGTVTSPPGSAAPAPAIAPFNPGKAEQHQEEGKSYMLPSEAEWEYAGRAGTTSFWYTGDDTKELQTAANLADLSFLAKFPGAATVPWDDGFPYTAPVGRFQPNAFGLYDMHGNVWERIQDWYDPKYYERSPDTDPEETSAGRERVLRRGGWVLPSFIARSAGHGDRDPPDVATQYTGFRIACDVKP